MAELLDSVLTGFETIEKLACYLATPRKSIIFFRDLLLMNRLFFRLAIWWTCKKWNEPFPAQLASKLRSATLSGKNTGCFLSNLVQLNNIKENSIYWWEIYEEHLLRLPAPSQNSFMYKCETFSSPRSFNGPLWESTFMHTNILKVAQLKKGSYSLVITYIFI